MRNYIEKKLSLANIQVSNDELAYLEVQMEVIDRAELSLKNYELFDVVPALVFVQRRRKYDSTLLCNDFGISRKNKK